MHGLLMGLGWVYKGRMTTEVKPTENLNKNKKYRRIIIKPDKKYYPWVNQNNIISIITRSVFPFSDRPVAEQVPRRARELYLYKIIYIGSI